MKDITLNEDGTFDCTIGKMRFGKCYIKDLNEVEFSPNKGESTINVTFYFDFIEKKENSLLDFYWKLKELGYDTRNIYVVETPCFLSKKDGSALLMQTCKSEHKRFQEYFKEYSFVYILLNDSYEPFKDDVLRYCVEN